MSEPLSQDSSLLARIWAWIMERFPPPNWIFSVLVFLVPFTWQQGGMSQFDIHAFGGIIATMLYFLILRVLDEHKDYELDCVNHPDRVLQRGLITLGHLKVIGFASAVAVTLWTLLRYNGQPLILITFGITIFWTFLMTKEFFIKEFLEKRLLLYGVSHMIVMVPFCFWLLCLSNPELSDIDGGHVGVAVLTFLIGAVAEVSRKFKAPAEEREGVDSYTKSLGVGGARRLLMILVSVLLLDMFYLLGTRLEGVPFLIAMLFPLLVFILSLKKMISFPNEADDRPSKTIENFNGLYLLVAYITMIVALSI